MSFSRPNPEAACPAGCTAALAVVFTLAGNTVRRCESCGLYLLDARPQPATTGRLDRSRFDDAFRDLRQGNYEQILEAVDRIQHLNGAKVLDVGCSNGWFLSAAGRRGATCFGIEPDPFFHERARRALPGEVKLVNGFFPGDLPHDWPRFEVITFHDVFEHLEDPIGVLRACADRLAPQGVLVLSVPSADGFVFRLSAVLRRLGFDGPLERAFQVHYPFPHLLYLAPGSLDALAERAGFEVVRRLPLRGFRLGGSMRRAQMDQAPGAIGQLSRFANGAALALFALLQPFVQADNIAAVLRLKNQ